MLQAWIVADKHGLVTTGRGKGAKMWLVLGHRGKNKADILS